MDSYPRAFQGSAERIMLVLSGLCGFASVFGMQMAPANLIIE
jgi:hypothetical protein